MRTAYLTRKHLEYIVYRLASDVFADYDSPMPTFTLMGREGEALLDSALALPRQTAGGKPAYLSLFDKAAVLFRSLNKNHSLVDGNKRMAVMATVVFLFVNGYILVVSPSDLVSMALNVASSPHPSLPHLSQWLREHSISWRPEPWSEYIVRQAIEERMGSDAGGAFEAIAKIMAEMYRQPQE